MNDWTHFRRFPTSIYLWKLCPMCNSCWEVNPENHVCIPHIPILPMHRAQQVKWGHTTGKPIPKLNWAKTILFLENIYTGVRLSQNVVGTWTEWSKVEAGKAISSHEQAEDTSQNRKRDKQKQKVRVQPLRKSGLFWSGSWLLISSSGSSWLSCVLVNGISDCILTVHNPFYLYWLECLFISWNLVSVPWSKFKKI